MNTNTVFSKKFDSIQTQIAYDANWENGTGYLDGVVNADLGLKVGDEVKCHNQHGRAIIIIGTRYGNVALFERYIDATVILSNIPKQLCNGPYGTALKSETIQRTVGFGGYANIGQWLEVESNRELVETSDIVRGWDFNYGFMLRGTRSAMVTLEVEYTISFWGVWRPRQLDTGEAIHVMADVGLLLVEEMTLSKNMRLHATKVKLVTEGDAEYAAILKVKDTMRDNGWRREQLLSLLRAST